MSASGQGGMLLSLASVTVCKGNTSCPKFEKDDYGTKVFSESILLVLTFPTNTPHL